jgi:mitochondrial fission protein ELM1
MTSANSTTCWALHDGAAGNRRQALALAQALDLAPREWSLTAQGLARWLAPRLSPGASSAFGRDFGQALNSAPPSLAIGCGRIAALATRLAQAAGARSVQILNPRISSKYWGLVIAPEHDGLSGANVISLIGSLNPVDEQWLADTRQQTARPMATAPCLTAVLLGGPTRATRFDRSALGVLLNKLDHCLAGNGGKAIICGSGRTPPQWASELRERYRDQGHLIWMDSKDGENPYAAALAWADRIIVSPDSVNMISEACSTALPVFIAEPDRATGRVGSFIQTLLTRGRVRAQTRDCELYPAEPLRETKRVATIVRERLSLR